MFDYNLTGRDIQVQSEELAKFHSKFAHYFRSKNKNVSKAAYEYLQGQMLTQGRRNMSQMTVQVSNINEQSLSHFIGKSPWKEEPVMTAIKKEVVATIGSRNGSLLIDESGFPKQGNKSVGVARQYCGSLGKVENCQVGVFVAYTNGQNTMLIDKRLYLPAKWVDDPDRCRRAGIPENKICFKTKAQLGLEMILQAKADNIPFEFVGMDAHYGEQPNLLNELEANEIEYMADVPCSTRIFLQLPMLAFPERRGIRGRRPTRLRIVEGQPIEVRSLLDSNLLHWETCKIRDIQRGELWVKFASIRVYRINKQSPHTPMVWLVIRKELDGSDVHYSFANANEHEHWQRLCEKQSTRYWVERALQDAKGIAGMDEYQFISWQAWHHHITMVFLAMLFFLTLQQRLLPKASLLSLQDARDILLSVMPRKHLSPTRACKIILQKHLNRFRSRISFLKKQSVCLVQYHILI